MVKDSIADMNRQQMGSKNGVLPRKTSQESGDNINTKKDDEAVLKPDPNSATDDNNNVNGNDANNE